MRRTDIFSIIRRLNSFFDVFYMNEINEIGESIWRVEGGKPGTNFIVSGGVHGNEKTGVHIVRRIKENIENGTLSVQSGILTFLLGNLQAIKLDERYTDSHVDLNRMFTDNLSAIQRMSYEGSRAKEIMDALQIESSPHDSVVGVDIHSTNTPSQPFLVSQKNLSELHKYVVPYLKTAETLLCDPNLIFAGELVTLDEYYARRGLGLCYETGHADDLSRVDIIYDEIVSLGMSLGVFAVVENIQHCGSVLPSVYTLRKSINLTEEGFEYAPGIGEGNFAPFSKGDVLGYYGKKPIIASSSGVFVFPKLKKHWEIGKSLGYIAECQQ